MNGTSAGDHRYLVPNDGGAIVFEQARVSSLPPRQILCRIELGVPAWSQSFLPPGTRWLDHLNNELLPFWSTDTALGNPLGAFPTYRCDDRTLYAARNPCPEIQRNRFSPRQQHLVALSCQAYNYGVAFHLTGNRVYLDWMKAGIGFIRQNAMDRVNGASGEQLFFLSGNRPEGKELATAGTDFGHNAKAFWMIHWAGSITGDTSLVAFAETNRDDIAQRTRSRLSHSGYSCCPGCDSGHYPSGRFTDVRPNKIIIPRCAVCDVHDAHRGGTIAETAIVNVTNAGP